MASKTYVPQLIRVLRKLRAYINKHNTTMAPYLTAAQQAALTNVVAAAAAFDGTVVQEAP